MFCQIKALQNKKPNQENQSISCNLWIDKNKSSNGKAVKRLIYIPLFYYNKDGK